MFLTKSVARDLERLVACGKAARQLPLSLMRCEVFGAGQSRITRGRRRRLAPPEMRDLIDASVTESYRDRQRRLDRLSGRIERILHASLYALVRACAAEAISLLIELHPDVDLAPLARALREPDDQPNVTPPHDDSPADRVMATVTYQKCMVRRASPRV